MEHIRKLNVLGHLNIPHQLEFSGVDSFNLIAWILSVTSFVLLLLIMHWIMTSKHPLDHIPAMGPTNSLLSYYGTYLHFRNSPKVIQEGYEKYQGAPFRIPLLDKWAVIICGQKYIEDMHQASRTDLGRAVMEIMQTDYTMGPDAFKDLYIIDVIRSPLYRNFPGRIPDIKDEIRAAFGDLLPSGDNDWIPMKTFDIMQQVVCRSVNRVFVDVPLCRDKDYVDLMVRYTARVSISALGISILPSFLKPFIAPLMSPLKESSAEVVKHLGAIIDDRLSADNEYGAEWPDRPNDIISWFLDYAQGDERETKNLARRVLFVNFASIHTTANILSQALYRLVISPEYIAPLQDELSEAFGESGTWSYSGLSKLVKLDSFIRECMRIEGPGQFLLTRMVINPKGFTFHDGTHLPFGTFVTGGAYSVHHDSKNYENPDAFDGFRFSKVAESAQSHNIKHRIVQPESSFIGFGYGSQVCPGRFFAAAQMKLIMAYILMTYDIKGTGNCERLPRNRWYAEHCLADPEYQIMLKERVQSCERWANSSVA